MTRLRVRVDWWQVWLLLLTTVNLTIALIEDSAYYAALAVFALLLAQGGIPSIRKDPS